MEGALKTLEIGLGYGIATLFICEGLLANGADGRHVAVDPYQLEGLPHHRTRFAGAGLWALEEAGARELVELHEEESQIVLPRLAAASTSPSSTGTTASKASSSTSSTPTAS